MASTARIDELKKKFDENPRRYFAPLANEFRKAGDIEQAIVICEEFLPQQPGHMSGHIVYGQALFEAAKMPEARVVFETALGLDPENLIALRHLGDIAHAQADYAAARGWYVRVLDADPRNEEIQGLIAAIDAKAAMDSPATGATGTGAAHPVDAPAPPMEFHLNLEDTDAFHVPAVPPPVPVVVASARAEGLEPAEFTPPADPIVQSSELDATLDSGVPSFGPPAEHVAPLSGLQGSGGIAHDELNSTQADTQILSAFPPLDIEGGLLVPSSSNLPTPVFAAPVIPEQPVADAEINEIPEELPPQVIAAEAELIDAGESPEPEPEATVEPHAADVPVNDAPFVTETMAELYVAQGFREQALGVYAQLLAADPDNERLRACVAGLTPETPVQASGPNVRDFFARFATRQPGVRAIAATPPSDDDFAMVDQQPAVAEVAAIDDVAALPEAVEEVAPAIEEVAPAIEEVAPAIEEVAPAIEEVAPAIERAAEMLTPGGSIDALFGNRAPGTTEDSAASALAQAFGGSTAEEPEIVGRPARAASGELSLDSVFRNGPARPPRPSQSFSFDQFFSEDAASGNVTRTSGSQQTQRGSEEAANPSAPVAERSADDIEQFNSWLQGLKPK